MAANLDGLMAVIANYLSQDNPPPNLVIQLETPADGNVMAQLGFRHENDLWIIGKDDALKAIQSYYGITKPFDWSNHWQQEKKRPFGG